MPTRGCQHIDKFIDIYCLLRLNNEETKNVERPITNKMTKLMIKNLPTKKNPDKIVFKAIHITREKWDIS